MKTNTPVFKIDLRKFPKHVRQSIKNRQHEIYDNLTTDMENLFNQDSITQEDFLNLFRKHFSSAIVSGTFNVENSKFKNDKTPNLRTLPVKVREVYKSHLKLAQEKVSKSVTDKLTSIDTASIEDLKYVMEISRKNSFLEKWVD